MNNRKSIAGYTFAQRVRYLAGLHAKNASTIVKFENEILRNARHMSPREAEILGVDDGRMATLVGNVKQSMNELSAFFNGFVREQFQPNDDVDGPDDGDRSEDDDAGDR